MSFIVFGHGYEKPGRFVVPDGCTLVLTEECGMLGTIPFRILEAMGTKTKEFWANPVKHKADIERLLGRKLRIYSAGKIAPRIYVSLLSDHSEKEGVYQPSGLHQLPLDLGSITFNPDEIGDERYETTDADLSFRGAVYKAGGWHSQETLFGVAPGVHYNLLCRESRLSSNYSGNVVTLNYVLDAVIAAFPTLGKTLRGPNIYDPVRVADSWITAQNSHDFTTIQKEVAELVHKEARRLSSARRTSGSPLSDRTLDLLVQLLATPSPPMDTVMRLINELPDVNAGIRHYGVTPLMTAARFGHIDVMNVLRKRGASLEVTDDEGATALHYACSSTDPEAALFLLHYGADVNKQDIKGNTPLMMAVSKPLLEPAIVEMIKRGADVNAHNKQGDTALLVAVGFTGMTSVIRLLFDARADVDHTNRDGYTALHQALEDKQEANAMLLLDTGAFDLNQRTKKGDASYLGLALHAGLEDVAIRLIKAGVEIKSIDAVRTVAKKKGLRQVLEFIG